MLVVLNFQWVLRCRKSQKLQQKRIWEAYIHISLVATHLRPGHTEDVAGAS